MFKRIKSNQTASSPLSNIVSHLRNAVDSSQLISPTTTRTALSLESVSDDQAHALGHATNELGVVIRSIASELGLEGISNAQVDAGVAGGVLAGDFKSFLSHKTDFPMISTESVGVISAGNISDAMSSRALSLEAYDERENRNAVIYSIAYNMQSAQQDEFGETFFPTIVRTPDTVGFGITVNIMAVFDGAEHKITGAFEDFKKRNIIRAIANPNILKKNSTKVTPVVRPQNAAMFVSNTIVAPYNVMIDDVAVTTAPIAFGKTVDILGLSTDDTLLAAGLLTQTDSLDPAVNLQAVYASFGDDVLRFNVGQLPLSNFVPTGQNNYRVQAVNFTTTSVLVNKNTKNVDGSALADLAGIVTGDLIVRVKLVASGSINIETGELSVFGNAISVHSISDANGNLLDLTTAPAAAIVAVINGGTLQGYDILGYRSNANMRQKGQFIDVTRYQQLYQIPLRSPITALHPVNVDAQTDAADVQALISYTRIRIANEAVTALLDASNALHEFIDARDASGNIPDVLGVGRLLVIPTYYEDDIDMATAIDSVKSHERAADMQAVLVNKIRDLAYRMYRDSEYKAAADALAGGIAPTPTVIIGTDPVLARYLTVAGDLRTLGDEFNVRIVSTLDYRMEGKIFITFGVFDENRNAVANPLNFGNMCWSPEVVLTANISQGTSVSKNTIVQPCYRFIPHLPVMGVLTVSNVPNVLSKVPLHFHQV